MCRLSGGGGCPVTVSLALSVLSEDVFVALIFFRTFGLKDE